MEILECSLQGFLKESFKEFLMDSLKGILKDPLKDSLLDFLKDFRTPPPNNRLFGLASISEVSRKSVLLFGLYYLG